jgi:hypothetical protein
MLASSRLESSRPRHGGHGVRWSLRFAGAFAGPATILLTAALGRAAEAPAPAEAPIHLELLARAACATRADLVERIRARSARLRFTDRAAGGPSLRVEIAAGPGGSAAAELTVVEAGMRRSARRLVAATCAQAVDAVALMIAILLDPSATASGPAAGAAAGSPAMAGAGVPAGSPGVAAMAGADQTPAAAPAPPLSARAPAAEPAGAAPAIRVPPPEPAGGARPIPAGAPPGARARHLGAGASFQGVSGPAPRLMLGGAVGVVAALDGESILSPGLRLTAAHYQLSGWVAAGGTADFSLDVLQLDVCPLGIRRARLGLRGCANATAGRLSARGYDTYAPQARARPFASLGGGAAVTLDLGAHLELEGLLGAGRPLVRDAFEFSPEVFHRVPAVTATFGLGLGLRFP